MVTLGIDCDGTLVYHDYPDMGKDLPDCVRVLRRLVDNGHKLILNTMRSGTELEDAVEWFKERKLPLYGVNKNPTQSRWTKSPKVFANLYIDDAALGAPIKFDEKIHNRPFIDWLKAEKMLEDLGLI
jgi:hypothetical protein